MRQTNETGSDMVASFSQGHEPDTSIINGNANYFYLRF
jgi:hypothetical protein